ncbi:MAG TPA: LAGLIDADG family homing endonuclease [Methylomirabilota bacterium]|nr:LAGLIDADG family homing endonuclease [Methylomirabilota bacterium]
MREEIEKIRQMMEGADYVTDPAIATSVHLAMSLKKPLLIEGHAGVGKTEVAKVMSRMLGTNLIRLQCYEGLDAAQALYEWNYPKQLLHIKLEEGTTHTLREKEATIFSEPFLIRRPLLQAISQDGKPPVLLIDEVDRCVTANTLVTTARGLRRACELRPGDEVVSFDPAAFRLSRSRVKKIVPRETERVVRLLIGGRFLEVTPEHRFVRYDGGGYEVVRADQLRRGDRVPLHKRYPAEASAAGPDLDFGDSMIKLTERGKQLLHSAYRASGQTYEQLSALDLLSAQLDVEEPLTQPEYATGLRARDCVALYELFGYIVADGCFTSDRLCIADKDHANLEVYADKFEEALGRRPRIVRGPHRNHELSYHSLPLGRFVNRVLGPGLARSRGRMVPDFVFAASAERRAGFVRGYFDGEGWVGHHQVSATSSSPYLLVGIQALLGSLGIDSHLSTVAVRPSSFGEGTYYTLSVSDVSAFAREVGFCAPAKDARLTNLRPPRFAKTETLPSGPVLDALRALADRAVLHGTPSHQTVGDILAGRVRPNVSSLRRIAAAFAVPELQELLGRDVVLGEVTSIETIEAPQAVYDFVLAGRPYFVANQIVTHNCDEEFEAFLLESLAEFQVTIPEIGTIKATHPPYVILTSNRVRELSDALRRRCLYLWIDFPGFDKEVRIVTRKVPGVNEALARQISRFMESLRTIRLAKVPGVAETLDWAQALVSLHADHLDEDLVLETLGCVLKDADDVKRFKRELTASGLKRFVAAEG